MYYVEMTDTYGGEANYCWVHRFRVDAKTCTGAIRKVGKETGFSGRIRADWDDGTVKRYNVRRAAICYFVEPWDEDSHGQYNIINL